ncbi:MAG: AP2 domain-containing protein [Chloroflexota bacterium]|nr:AP2 domain-containing protein [Chloroflexota bacterium]
MAKLIVLTQDKFATVDDEDFDWLNQWRWRYSNQGYAVRDTTRPKNTLLMHRVIMSAPADMEVDHCNHNGLDNRRINLRLCTKSQNRGNLVSPHMKQSGYKGVFYMPRKRPWKAQINIGQKSVHLGMFATPEEAARAYDEAAKAHFGEFVKLNFPSGTELKTEAAQPAS